FVTVNSKWAHSDPKAIEMTNDLAIVIALDQEPYAMVEHYGFGGFLEKRFPWYQIPTADHMARVAIPQLYQSVAEPVRQILSASKTVAIATDGWTAENAAFEILGLIVFTIQDDGKLNRVVLCCPEIRGSANAENMKIVIKQICALVAFLDCASEDEPQATGVQTLAKGLKKEVESRFRDVQQQCWTHTTKYQAFAILSLQLKLLPQ
uniref:DUF659 domain-containing protein n=1 Tax=Macrostomum lignano TaxID=282301 RepID=A0A1I8J2X3_9PLAT